MAKLSEFKMGDKFSGKYSGVTLMVTGTDENFMNGRGGGTIFAMQEGDTSRRECSYRLDTFLDYYERIQEVKTICQRFAAGWNKAGDALAFYMEYDSVHGHVMSITVEHDKQTPERLHGIPQLPDVGITKKEFNYWIRRAKSADNVLFFE